MEVSEKLLIPKRIIFHNWSTIIFLHIYMYIYTYIYIYIWRFPQLHYIFSTIFPIAFNTQLVHDGSYGQLPELRPPPEDCGLANGKKMSISYHPWKNLWSIWSPVQNVFFELRFFWPNQTLETILGWSNHSRSIHFDRRDQASWLRSTPFDAT